MIFHTQKKGKPEHRRRGAALAAALVPPQWLHPQHTHIATYTKPLYIRIITDKNRGTISLPPHWIHSQEIYVKHMATSACHIFFVTLVEYYYLIH